MNTLRELCGLVAVLLEAAWTGCFFLSGWLAGAAIASVRAGWVTGRKPARLEVDPTAPWVTESYTVD